MFLENLAHEAEVAAVAGNQWNQFEKQSYAYKKLSQSVINAI